MKFIMQGHWHRKGPPPSMFCYKKLILFFLCFFYFRRCAIISDSDFDFERVLNRQQLLYFHTTTEALCKSSETMDDMKFDASSDTDRSSESTYSFSEENSDNVTFYRWQMVETKTTKSKKDVAFEGTQRKCLKMTSKHWKSTSTSNEGR